ncbi:MAG TPA: SIMPL domain-containing protein [Candidatus Nitrosotenuis sp.]|nr:SIMPL domain-containing protein [Candidatus Nitrosotenuis sp.]
MNKNAKYSILVFAAVIAAITIATIPNTQNALGQSAPEASSIKVTGDASIKVDPDQAVMVIVVQTPPSEITVALDEQKSKANKIVQELRSMLGTDETSSITVGQMSLNPVYGGAPSYSGISTFTIYSSTAIETNIDGFSDIVRKLKEAGFGFEGVYAVPVMPQSASFASAEQADASTNKENVDVQKDANKITLNVSINTKPGTLDDVLAEYDSKYKTLVSILEEAGILPDQIKPVNVSINPFFYGPTQSSTYQTYSQIVVRTDPRNIEKISDMVQQQGAYVENTFLSVSDGAIEKLRDRLNKQAFDNAKLRAESMAKLAGMKVGAVKNIESTTSVVNPYGGYQSYKGLYVVPPYYYQSVSGEIASSITVEFWLEK